MDVAGGDDQGLSLKSRLVAVCTLIRTGRRRGWQTISVPKNKAIRIAVLWRSHAVERWLSERSIGRVVFVKNGMRRIAGAH